MNYLSGELAKQFKKIFVELEDEKGTKRKFTRCEIERIKDEKELSQVISKEPTL